MNSKNGYSTYIPATIQQIKHIHILIIFKKIKKLMKKKIVKIMILLMIQTLMSLINLVLLVQEQFNLNNNNLDNNFSAGNKYMNFG